MAFLYVSGMGTDSSERGRLMWARVKGATENALLSLPFRAYGIRPGFILPVHGVRTKTRLSEMAYQVTGWLYPVLKRVAPGHVMTSEELGRAMIVVAVDRPERRVLDTKGLKALMGSRRQIADRCGLAGLTPNTSDNRCYQTGPGRPPG